jgi:hypothetical protein
MRRFSVFFAILVLIVSVVACYSGERLPLTFSPEKLPGASVGETYDVEIAVSNNVTPVYRIRITSGDLPPGLEFVFEEGTEFATIRGNPEAVGEYHFSVFVSCYGTSVNGQTGKQEYVIVVE